MLKNKITFLVITETWLNIEKDYALELGGYKSVSIYRNRLGGGIKIYFLDYINVSVIDILPLSETCETLFLKAIVPGFGKLTLGGIYRPPNKSVPNFLLHMSDILSSLSNTRSVICGDFNLDIMKLNECNQVSDYVDVMSSYGFINSFDIPTYVSPITNSDSSCLDHLWHNLSIDNKNFVIGPNLADHYAISSLFNKNIDHKPKSFQFRDFSLVSRERFSSNMDVEFSAFSPPTHNVDVYTKYLERFLFEMLRKYFPLKRKTITSKRLRAPWLCADIMVCIHKKHKWHKMAKQGLISFCSYKKYCTLLRKLLTLAEKDYFLKKLNSLGTDPKKKLVRFK